MTISESLDEDLKGFVSNAAKLLKRQGLNPDEESSEEIENSSAFKLAYAWGLYAILWDPNLSEGDWSRIWGNRDDLRNLISSIFNRFAPDENPLNPRLVDISGRW